MSVRFKSLEKLNLIIENEKYFQIQIFSLESIDTFENYLEDNKISFKRCFSSNYEITDNKITILQKDSENFPVSVVSRIILYSNERDRRFIPFAFKITEKEKENFISNKSILKANSKLSVASILRKDIDVCNYIAESLSYEQSVIVFCLVRESRFSKLYNEIINVDNSLRNRFLIKLELNGLLQNKIIKKSNNLYKINISKECVQKICEKIGFSQALL
ncbi:hypothetical protein NUSPORA_02092 [Nucleospora cyclopteri]